MSRPVFNAAVLLLVCGCTRAPMLGEIGKLTVVPEPKVDSERFGESGSPSGLKKGKTEVLEIVNRRAASGARSNRSSFPTIRS